MSNPSETGIPTPHEGQEKVLALPGRYKIAGCGRRFGKTVAAAIAAVRTCEKRDDRRVWWISPIQEQSDRVEREVAFWLKDRTVSPRSKRKAKNDDDATQPNSGADPTWSHRVADHAGRVRGLLSYSAARQPVGRVGFKSKRGD